MEENINISNKIDRYILGQMDNEEKTSFENELCSSVELKQEYELQREIILATQRVHFKLHLQNIEQQERLKRKKMIMVASYWGIAAAIACLSIIGVDIKYSSDLNAASVIYYTETGAPLTRSDSEIDELLIQAYELIGKNELVSASEKINKAETMISESLKHNAITEEEEYRKEIMLMQNQDIYWYRTLILMQEGKIFKSRKALKKIAASDSRYADKARDILETNYLF